MRIEEALAAKLAAVLAGGVLADAVYPDAGPARDAADPPRGYLVYQHSGDDNRTLLSGGREATRIDLFDLEIWHPDRGVLAAVRDALFDAFAGVTCQGRWGGPGGVWVQGAVASDASADAAPPAQGDEEMDRGERLSLRITWTWGV